MGDQVLRERGGYDGQRVPEKKPKGSWKISDQTLLDFISNTKKALASEAEGTSSGSDHPAMKASSEAVSPERNSRRSPPPLRIGLANTGGCSSTNQSASSS